MPLLLADGIDLHLIDPDGDGLERLAAELNAGDRITTATSAIDQPEACEAALSAIDRPILASSTSPAFSSRTISTPPRVRSGTT